MVAGSIPAVEKLCYLLPSGNRILMKNLGANTDTLSHKYQVLRMSTVTSNPPPTNIILYRIDKFKIWREGNPLHRNSEESQFFR